MKKQTSTFNVILIGFVFYEFITFRGLNPLFYTTIDNFSKSINLYDPSKSVLENLYYLSGIVITFTLWFAYYSLKINKDTIKDEKKRNENFVTYQICEKYSDNILPEIEKFRSKYMSSETRIQDLSKELKNLLDNKSAGIQETKIIQIELLKKFNLDGDYYNNAIDLLNKLEIIAIAFHEDLPSIKIARSIMKATFSPFVDMAKPVITFEQIEDPTSFELIVDLYEKLQ